MIQLFTVILQLPCIDLVSYFKIKWHNEIIFTSTPKLRPNRVINCDLGNTVLARHLENSKFIINLK